MSLQTNLIRIGYFQSSNSDRVSSEFTFRSLLRYYILLRAYLPSNVVVAVVGAVVCVCDVGWTVCVSFDECNDAAGDVSEARNHQCVRDRTGIYYQSICITMLHKIFWSQSYCLYFDIFKILCLKLHGYHRVLHLHEQRYPQLSSQLNIIPHHKLMPFTPV